MIGRIFPIVLLMFGLIWTNCGGGGGGSGAEDISPTGTSTGSSTGGDRNPLCIAGISDGEVKRPVWVANLSGQTSWFASPVVADLDDDGENELIAAYCSLYAFTPDGDLIHRRTATASWKSWSRPSTMAWISSRFPDRDATAFCGPRPGAGRCGWVSPTTSIELKGGDKQSNFSNALP